MLIDEAQWFARMLGVIDIESISPMLNVGSSTGEFRERQPWIEACIFQPFRDRGGLVLNLDLKDAPGVDIVGDLADAETREKLAEHGFRSVFCANILEHVRDRASLCEAILSVLPEGGHVFASCPSSYPYHPDPIDTMFRPSVRELTASFPGTSVLHGETIECGTYARYAFRNLASALRVAGRLGMPFYKSAGWKMEVDHLPWFFKQFEVSCLVLTKSGESKTEAVEQTGTPAPLQSTLLRA